MSFHGLLSDRDLALVDAVAARVVELLDQCDRPQPCQQLLSAAELAHVLGVSRSTVYEHARELGAVRLGNGTRARLRFDVEQARREWTSREASERSEPPDPPVPAGVRRRRQRGATQSDDELLPVRS